MRCWVPQGEPLLVKEALWSANPTDLRIGCVDIYFDSEKLQKECSDQKRRLQLWGAEGAKKLMLRLQHLDAAETLEDMRSLPGRCHELKGDRSGQLALDLVHPRRLILVPTDDPPPMKPDGGLDWNAVTRVTVLEVIDYH